MISRPATVQDIFRIDLQPDQAKRDPRALVPKDVSDEDFMVYRARTIEIDGEVIACFGLTPTLPYSGEAWALLSKKALDLKQALTDEVFYWLDRTQDEFEIRRVTAVAAEDHPAAHRWLLKLGFEPEGRMRKYGLNGDTYWLYGRIR